MVWMEAFLYTKGIQLTATHSGGRCSDLTHLFICLSLNSEQLLQAQLDILILMIQLNVQLM